MSSVPRPALRAPSSAPDTPTGGAEGSSKNRRVNFPNDDLIVSGYLEPPNPWEKASDATPEELVAAYSAACEKHNVKPLPKLLHQLKHINIFGDREDCLSLKGEKLDSKHCEAMEEIFKRVQFRTIDIESTYLDDEGSVALFDMIEYYESAENLNISNNKNISSRGWQACARMIKKTGCLETLEARNSCIEEQTMAILCRTLRTNTNLMVLHLENCGISGRAFTILMTSMKLNSHLQELYLGYNKLSSADAIHLGQLLAVNTSLQVLDLRHNHIQDSGVAHIVDGLLDQPTGMGGGLQCLVLFNNQLNHMSAMHLAKAVANTKTLQHLNLGSNNLTNEGIFSLKDALMKNRTLNYLGLQGTKITCEGAITLAECFADNLEMHHLDLRDNAIKIAGLLALSLSMKVNSSIRDLELDKELKKGTKDQQEQHQRLIAEILGYCDRNKKVAEKKQAEEEESLRHLEEEKLQAHQEPEEKLSESVCRLLSLWDHSPPSPRLTHSPSPTHTENVPESSAVKEKLPTENKFRSKFKANRSSALLDDKGCGLPIIVIPAGEKSSVPSLSVDLPPSSPQPVNPALLSPPPVSPSPTKSRFRVSRVMLDAESPSSSAGNTPMPSPVPSPGNTPVPSPTVTPVPSPGCTPLPSPVPSPVGSPVSSPCHSPMGNGSHAPPSSPVLNRATPVRHGFICGASAAAVPAHSAMISSSPPMKPPRTDLAAFAMMTLAAKNARDGTKAPPCTPADLSPLGFQKSIINGIFAPPPSPADSDLSSKLILPSSTNLLLPSPEEDISCSSSSSSSSNPDTNNTIITPPLSPIDDDSLCNQEFSSVIATPSSPNDISSLQSDSFENDSDSVLSSVNSVCMNELQTSPSYAASTVSMATSTPNVTTPSSLEESSSSSEYANGNVFTFNTDEFVGTPSESYVSSSSESVPSISCSENISTSVIKSDSDLLVPPNSPFKVMGSNTSTLIASDSLASNHTSTLLQFWNVLWGSPTLPKQSESTATEITPNESIPESSIQSVSDVSMSADSGVETPDYNSTVDSSHTCFYPFTETNETPNKVSVPSENLNFPFEVMGSVAPPSSPAESLLSVSELVAPPATPSDSSSLHNYAEEKDFIENCLLTHLIKPDLMDNNSAFTVPNKISSEHDKNRKEADKNVRDALNDSSLLKNKTDCDLAVSESPCNVEVQPMPMPNEFTQSHSPDFLTISNHLSQPTIKKNTSISLPSSPSKQSGFSQGNAPAVKSLSKDNISDASSKSAKAINSKYRVIKLAEPSCVRLFGGGIPNRGEKKENPTVLLSSPSKDKTSPTTSSDSQTVITSHSTEGLSSFQAVENIQNKPIQNSRFTIINISKNDGATSNNHHLDSENLCESQPKPSFDNIKEGFLEAKDEVQAATQESHSENQFIKLVPEILTSENNERKDSFSSRYSDSDVNGNLSEKADHQEENSVVNDINEDNYNKTETLTDRPTVLRRIKLPVSDKKLLKDRRASTGSFFGAKQEQKKESKRRISLTVDELIQQQLIELHNSFKSTGTFSKKDSIEEGDDVTDQKSPAASEFTKSDFSNSLSACEKNVDGFSESSANTNDRISEIANNFSEERKFENNSSSPASDIGSSNVNFISSSVNLSTEDSEKVVGLSRDSKNICIENETFDTADSSLSKATDTNEHSCNLDTNYNCNLECIEKKNCDFSNVSQTVELTSYCQCLTETCELLDKEREIDTDTLQKSVSENSMSEIDKSDCTKEEVTVPEPVKCSEIYQKDSNQETIHVSVVENGNVEPCTERGLSNLHLPLDSFPAALTAEFSSSFLSQREVPSEPVIVRQRLVGSVAPSLSTSNEEALTNLPELIGNLTVKEEEGGGFSTGSLPLAFLEDSTTSPPRNNNGLLCFLEGLNLKNGTTTSPILESDINVARAAQDGTTSVLQT